MPATPACDASSRVRAASVNTGRGLAGGHRQRRLAVERGDQVRRARCRPRRQRVLEARQHRGAAGALGERRPSRRGRAAARKPAASRGTRSASVGAKAAARGPPGARSTWAVARRPSSSAATWALTPSRRGLSSSRPAVPAAPALPVEQAAQPGGGREQVEARGALAASAARRNTRPSASEGVPLSPRAVDRAADGAGGPDHEVVAGERRGRARRQRQQRRAGVAAGGPRAQAGERALGGGAVVDGGDQQRLGAGVPPSSSATADLVAEPRADVAGVVQPAGGRRQRHRQRRDAAAHGREAAGEREQAGVLGARVARGEVRVEQRVGRDQPRGCRPARRRRRAWRARAASATASSSGAGDAEQRSARWPASGPGSAACARRSR